MITFFWKLGHDHSSSYVQHLYPDDSTAQFSHPNYPGNTGVYHPVRITVPGEAGSRILSGGDSLQRLIPLPNGILPSITPLSSKYDTILVLTLFGTTQPCDLACTLRFNQLQQSCSR